MRLLRSCTTMTDRRYDDEEIAAIFRTAAEAPQALPPQESRVEGLTLAELQAIGRDVGISPEAVSQAALALDVRGTAQARTLLGLPIGVARTVNLDRRFTDEEWEHLVVELREVFQARGVTRSDGSLRQWTNGNLQVLLEPTQGGSRLRLSTLHGVARAWIGGGLATLGVAAALFISSAVLGDSGEGLRRIMLLALGGSVMVVNGALRLPGWARLRERQMEGLAARLAGPAGSATRPSAALPPG
jgi:hypothetical protein